MRPLVYLCSANYILPRMVLVDADGRILATLGRRAIVSRDGANAVMKGSRHTDRLEAAVS
jgi:hypothetical protein